MLDARSPDPDIAAAGVEHTLALRPRAVARDVQHQVVSLAALREILFRVVDDPVRADRAHDFDMARAADRGHLGAKRFGDLDSERADATRGTIDQNPLSRLDPSV